jgi:hypothetical protein
VKLLEELGVTTAMPEQGSYMGLSFHAYVGLGHSLSDQEINHLANWLQGVIPP